MGAVLVAVGLTLLVSAASLAAMCFRFETLVSFLLTLHLFAWAEIMLIALALSVFGAFARPGILAGLGLSFAVATVVWSWRGRPRPIAIRPRLRWLWSCLRRPHLALLGLALAAGYPYLVALGLLTPQNDGDPLVYQLTRAALWRQRGGVGVIDVPSEPRLAVNPIVGEVGQATSFILAASERFVWLVQLSSVAALALGAFAIARRVGLSPSAALFGGLVVPALPVVATQSITGYNDLVVASFLVSAVAFVLGATRAELAPLLLAVALGIGTKFTAPFALPVVVLAGALGQPRRRWPAIGAVMVGGTLLGGGWYLVNLVRTGSLDGGLAALADQEARRSLGPVVETTQFLLLDSLERPGTARAGLLVVLGVGLAIAGIGAYQAACRRGINLALAGLIIFATPIVVEVASPALGWLFSKPWEARGYLSLANELRGSRASTLADGVGSWYGPLATVVGFAVMCVTISRVRRNVLARSAIAAATAPWIGIAILAIAIAYDPWRGRFLVALWVLNVAVWGVLERHRAVVLSIASVTALTFGLCLVAYYGRPLGIDQLSERSGPSIWGLERWQAQTMLRDSPRGHGERFVIREVERRVPADARIAVSVRSDDFVFPYFGAQLGREVRPIGPHETLPADAEWLAASPEAMPLGCSDAWRTVALHRSGWGLYRRSGPDTCLDSINIRRTPLGTAAG